MTLIYLRADGLDHLKASMIAAGLATQGLQNELDLKPGVSLDIIGEISVFDGESLVANVPGTHANLRVIGMDLTESQLDQLPVIPEPVTPFRTWA